MKLEKFNYSSGKRSRWFLYGVICTVVLMVLMNLFYSVLEMLSESIFGWMGVLPPLITPLFHAYFDLFSGFIQTTVFCMLTMLLVAQEGPQDDELSSELTEVGNKK